jgi:hypothetical protein
MGLKMKNKSFSILRAALLALLFAGFLLASCDDMFQPKIPMSQENDSLDNLFRSAEGITKLETPPQFYIAPYYSNSVIRLTWSAVPGAEYYLVERAVAEPSGGSWEEPNEGDYEPLNRFVYQTSYTDEILKTPALDSPEFNNRYYYRVSAFNTFAKYDESDPTTPQSAMLFRVPANVKASGGTETDKVVLEWDEAPGAVSYEVWRSELPNGNSASILGTAQNVRVNGKIRYTNTVTTTEQGRDFYYLVKAVNSFGGKALETRPAYGYARMAGAPDDPKNVRLAPSSGRGHSKTEIKIEWYAVAESDAYYAVYRYSENDSSLTRLADKWETTSFTDSLALKPGIFYYYKVQAILDDISSGKQLKSQFSSDDQSLCPMEGYILSSPDELIAEKSGSNIVIKWRPAKSSEAERSQFTYNVYADPSLNGSFTTIAASGVQANVQADGYISAPPLSSSSYGGQFFKVTSIKSGLESEKSGAVSPSPAAAVIDSASQRASIASENANPNGVYPVAVTWKKPDDDNPAFYHVQRSTNKEGGYSRINSAPLRADGLGSNVFYYEPSTRIFTFIDRNESARVGRKYYYRVLSLNQLEQGSFQSDYREGYGALTHTQYLLEYNKTMTAALKKLTLMYKSVATDKLGSETKNGGLSGSISYNAKMDGAGARIIIQLTNYAEFYIENESANGVYFTLNGNSNTSANMSSNGTMDGTVTCTGMYPGRIYYDKIQIKGGGAGGGTYGVEPNGFSRAELSYTVLN